MTRLRDLTLALIVGCAVGAAIVSAVHASAKLPAFTIAEIEVTDLQAFQTFAKMNIEQINAAGGRFLAQRGGSSPSPARRPSPSP